MSRLILAEISSNERRGPELSNGKRNFIVGRWYGGQKIADIARAEQVPYYTAYRLIERYKESGIADVKQRSGRPAGYTTREIRAITRTVRKDPKLTY
jgi:transposase